MSFLHADKLDMKQKLVCNLSPVKNSTPTFEELAMSSDRHIDNVQSLADLVAELTTKKSVADYESH